MPGPDVRDRTTLVAFIASVLLGAGNPIAIRAVSCETCELEPFFAADRSLANRWQGIGICIERCRPRVRCAGEPPPARRAR